MVSTSADNKFGPSSYVVGTVLGDGCNYTSIQSAINDAVAAGGSSVLIRAGSYTENLSLGAGIDLLGVAGDGRPPVPVVSISGNHTMTANGFSLLQDIGFSAAAGDLFTITAPPGGNAVVGAKYCRVSAATGRAVVVTGTGGGAAFISISSEVSANTEAFLITDASVQLDDCSVTSNTTYALSISGSSGINAANGSIINGTLAAVVLNSATTNCVTKDCTFSASNGPCFLFNAAATVANTNTLQGSSGISGYYVEGTGFYQYAGDYFNGGNTAIDPLVTVSVYPWKPHATAGTTLNAFRGTSSFDSTQFTVTDGFVQFTGAPISWVDRAVSATVVSNQGNFITAIAVQLTLPAAPVQGDVCLFKGMSGNPFDILANAGQTMQFGSTTGTIATSSLIGDAVDLTYYAAGSAWVANSIVGIWNVT